MKNRNLFARLTLPATVAVAVLIVGVASAQPSPDAPRRRPSQPDAPRGERPPLQPPRPGLEIERVLTDEQRETFRAAREGAREHLRELQERTQQARRELHETMFSEKADEEVIRKHAATLAALEAERVVTQARVLAKIQPGLTPDQRERLRDLRPDAGPPRRETRRDESDVRPGRDRERKPARPPGEFHGPEFRRDGPPAFRRPDFRHGEDDGPPSGGPPRRPPFKDERGDRPPLPPARP